MKTANDIIIDVLMFFVKNRFDRVARFGYGFRQNAIDKSAVIEIAEEVRKFFVREIMPVSYEIENSAMPNSLMLKIDVKRALR